MVPPITPAAVRERSRQIALWGRQHPRRVGLVASAILLLLLGVLILPPIVRHQLQKRLTQELQREVVVGPLRINPFALAVTSRNFHVTDHDGSRLVAWERLHVNFELRSLWSDAWIFDQVHLLVPEGRVIVREDGTLNISDLLERANAETPEATPPAPPRPVRIRELIVDRGRVEFEDHAQPVPFATTIGPLTFTLHDFLTAGGSDAPYSFDGVSEAGERFTWSGAINLTPVRSAGAFSAERLLVPKYAAYLQSFFHGELRDGRLTMHGRYVLDLSPAKRRAELSGGLLQLDNLIIAPSPSHDPSLQITRLNATGIEAQLEPMNVQIDTLSVQGGAAAAHRARDGAIDVLHLVSTGNATNGPPSESSDSTPTPPLAARIAHLALNNFAFAWSDASTPQAAQVEGVLERLDVREFSLEPGAEAEVRARVKVAPSGVFAIDGRIALDPLRLTAQTELETIPLAAVSPYVEALSGVRIERGALTLSGKLEGDRDSPTIKPNLRWEGSAAVTELATTVGASGDPLLRFERLELREISARSSNRMTFRVGEVDLSAPEAHAVIRADGSLNFAALAPATESGPTDEIEVPVVAASATTSPAITVGRTRVRNGSFTFQDRSVQPAVRTSIHQLEAEVGQLSSTRMDRADLKLECQVADIGHLSANGHVNPLNPAAVTAFTVSVRNVDLKPVGPYVAKYAGYALDRGRVDLDLDYRIQNRAIQAQNVVKLDQFTLGAPSGSPDATTLPVTLAIALLKDRRGLIEIDLPIEGSLDDPAFRIGRVVGRVLVNMLTRAATSPFALLGALVPGGAAQPDLSQVPFTAGTAELDEPGHERVAQLARIMEERPALRLELSGGIDPEADLLGLQRQRLDLNVRRYVWAQRRSTDPNLPPAEQLELPPEEREQVLRVWYRQRFLADTAPATAADGKRRARNEQSADAQSSTADRNVGRPGTGAPSPFRRMMRALGFSESDERVDTVGEISERTRALAASATADVSLDDVESRLAAEITVDEVDVQALGANRPRTVRKALENAGIDGQRIIVGGSQTNGPHVTVTLK